MPHLAKVVIFLKFICSLLDYSHIFECVILEIYLKYSLLILQVLVVPLGKSDLVKKVARGKGLLEKSHKKYRSWFEKVALVRGD